MAEITAIDPENKQCTTAAGESIGFDKLVIATGSTPVRPNWLTGASLENVFIIPKDKEYLDCFTQGAGNFHEWWSLAAVSLAWKWRMNWRNPVKRSPWWKSCPTC
ncbi:MAG: hypothetical protein R2860_13405 [Desulfobacterales bacterium]